MIILSMISSSSSSSSLYYSMLYHVSLAYDMLMYSNITVHHIDRQDQARQGRR